MNESSYIRSINRHITAFSWKINDNYAGGVPDAFYEGGRSDLWVEYKYIPSPPKRGTTLVDPTKLLSPLQTKWLNRRHDVRRDAWVVIGTPAGALIFTSPVQWETALPAEEFILYGKRPVDVAHAITLRIA